MPCLIQNLVYEGEIIMNRQQKLQHWRHGTGKRIFTKVGKAMGEYEMLAEGDHILAAISGGKDSFAMLDMLLNWRRVLPFSYSVSAMHVTTDFTENVEVRRAQLQELFDKYEVPGFIVNVDVTTSLREGQQLSCYHCARRRRIALFQKADEIGANKIALGHHMDDMVETVLMNMFFSGNFSTMKPKLSIFQGKMQIIRPLAFVEERLLREFRDEQRYPSETCQCSYNEASMRAMVKKLLNDLEETYPEIKNNIFSSMRNIETDYLI